MSKHARVLGAGAIVLALTVSWNLFADEKATMDAVDKLAAALAKGDAAAAKKEAEGLKKADLETLMHLFKLRKSHGFGVGDKPGAITPDGIELKIGGLAKKTLAGDLKTQSEAITQLAYRTAALAELTLSRCPIEKKKGEKDPKDWEKWTKSMKEGAMELAKAAKDKDAAKVEAAAKKINNNCQQCHGVFRD